MRLFGISSASLRLKNPLHFSISPNDLRAFSRDFFWIKNAPLQRTYLFQSKNCSALKIACEIINVFFLLFDKFLNKICRRTSELLLIIALRWTEVDYQS